ncbi:protein MALE DISCOVERER 2-like [Hevea brasiliensis]|uniref:protein MALE DISCOVERER 2-like n=1 Tax=Hevea brasiliensis TaxID=3981 RepID=UPI0025CD2728|nr:protein MALE DISCOVERER 2-like [Hevea brasiliensis]
MLSRVNHKNFVNLIGYCEEDEPFNRMMIFEYAPNGTLFKQLHVKETEHLNWSARIRIIMGIAYSLQDMHHHLNPLVAHSNLNSHNIFLVDDYAAKITEISFLPQDSSKLKSSGDNESVHSTLPPLADVETNVYCFGILLLEIISGKLQYSEEQGSLEKLAAEYLNDKCSITYLIDPILKSFKKNELDLICKIIQECIQPDSRQRSTMKDITSKLREVIAISPDQATPRLSPLWWAELEILSVEIIEISFLPQDSSKSKSSSDNDISYLIDPTLKSFKNNELDLICEIIQECIQPDPRQRPTMKDITSKLREVIAISLDQATPRLSPLWWAELEILFVEAT